VEEFTGGASRSEGINGKEGTRMFEHLPVCSQGDVDNLTKECDGRVEARGRGVWAQTIL
jgi:hypothetical protein